MGAVILYCDDRDISGRHNRIIYHNNTVGLVNADPVQPHASGEYQTVVSVKFTELTITDGHVHLNTAAHLTVHVLPKKGQLALAAHAVRTLKGEIALHPGAEIQAHALRTEHIPCLLLTDLLSRQRAAAVENSGEVHIENDIGKTIDQMVVCRL